MLGLVRNPKNRFSSDTFSFVSAKAKKEQEEAELARDRADPVKFGLKAKEQPVSNVQPTNVLETGKLLYMFK